MKNQIDSGTHEQIDFDRVASILRNWSFMPYGEFAESRKHIANNWLSSCKQAMQTPAENLICLEGTSAHGWMALISKLAWDSEFFGAGIARIDPLISPIANSSLQPLDLHRGTEFIESLCLEARNNAIEKLFAIVDVRDSLANQALEQNGFRIMDTIATYSLSLEELPKYELDENNLREARPEDASRLKEIAADVFSDRALNVNRFNSDSRINIALVEKLYGAWAERSLSLESLADLVLVYETDHEIAGFISIKFASPESPGALPDMARIPLNAVARQYQSQGIYSTMLDGALAILREQNQKHVEIKTQIGNFAIHRAWQKRSAVLRRFHHTFHKWLIP